MSLKKAVELGCFVLKKAVGFDLMDHSDVVVQREFVLRKHLGYVAANFLSQPLQSKGF